jgi:hypothetical protein
MKLLFQKLIKPIAWVAYRKKARQRRLGEVKGMVEIRPDFDQLP